MSDDSTTVLIVDDEPDVAETYEFWLHGEYDVRVANGGQEALDRLEGVDVVLLDRMMPKVAGDEVLAEIRVSEHDPRVAMVTAVDPDFDIIEMGFDDYVTKPPTGEELREVVSDLAERDEHAERLQEYRSLVATRSALAAEKPDAEIEDSEEYADLNERIDDLEAALDDEEDRLLDDAAFVATLREVTDEEGTDE